MNSTTVGVDLAHRIFFLHGQDERGRVVLREKITRSQLCKRVANMEPCTIAMEACAGSNFWARRFQAFGHVVRLINPRFVKPFLKSNKNDWNDAAAICDAAQKPTMRFVGAKSLLQQEILSIHRVRQRLVTQRTALINQIRGLLHEFGFITPKTPSALRKHLPEILATSDPELTPRIRNLVASLREEMLATDQRIESLNGTVLPVAREEPRVRNLLSLPGVGALSATAITATVGDASVFKSGRQMAAFLGLVPRQFSSGGRPKLAGISKRGDKYLRCLLVHGARATIRWAAGKTDARSWWIQQLLARRGIHRTIVAVANKNARIAWALMSQGSTYNMESGSA